LTIEYRAEALVQYRVALESNGRQLRDVGEPTLFPHRYPSPQPFLPALDQVAWHPASRLAPYRSRRQRDAALRQERLIAPEEHDAAASGNEVARQRS
jgi:hypothetical protein